MWGDLSGFSADEYAEHDGEMANKIFADWLAHPTYGANVMNGNLYRAGVGAVIAEESGIEVVYAVLVMSPCPKVDPSLYNNP